MLLRLGRIEEAEIVLQSIAERRPRHAGWLNLMGVIFESRGAWRWARRLYGKAMRAGRGFAPAEQNMRRCYELFTFGRTNLPVALGDD
jgi:Flp pilus assembly protein TadD